VELVFFVSHMSFFLILKVVSNQSNFLIWKPFYDLVFVITELTTLHVAEYQVLYLKCNSPHMVGEITLK
jgi:hypothetical protein